MKSKKKIREIDDLDFRRSEFMKMLDEVLELEERLEESKSMKKKEYLN